MGDHGYRELAERVITSLLDGNLFAIAVTAFIAFGLPVLLHLIFYQSVASPPLSNFLLLGPSGAGKTAFLTLLESKSSRVAQRKQLTHTSQASSSAIVSLPASVQTASNRYRSVNDSSLKDVSRNPVKYRVKDTPGHGKLRSAQGLSELVTMSSTRDKNLKLRGVVFMIDTAAMNEEETLRDTASYLHDVLLALQKRALKSGRSPSKVASEIPVLVAANKQDLFTALPAASVREKLEAEIDRIRKSKSKGLMNASEDVGATEDEDDTLGSANAQDTFTFKLLENEVGVKVDVVDGAVKGDEEGNLGAGVRKWEDWIGQCL